MVRHFEDRIRAEGNKSTEQTAQTPHSQMTPTAIQSQISSKLSGGGIVQNAQVITPRGLMSTLPPPPDPSKFLMNPAFRRASAGEDQRKKIGNNPQRQQSSGHKKSSSPYESQKPLPIHQPRLFSPVAAQNHHHASSGLSSFQPGVRKLKPFAQQPYLINEFNLMPQPVGTKVSRKNQKQKPITQTFEEPPQNAAKYMPVVGERKRFS